MASNIDRYKADLARLVAAGEQLVFGIQRELFPHEFEAALKKGGVHKVDRAVLAKLPSARDAYQPWYSEAKAFIKQLLPDRLDDFVRHYEKPKARKEITYENYRIEDYRASP